MPIDAIHEHARAEEAQARITYLEAENARMRAALERIQQRYRTLSDGYRPQSERNLPEYGRGWHDGNISTLAGCSLIVTEALDPKAHAEGERAWTLGCQGTDVEWYEDSGHCGGCGSPADSCGCDGACGCWEAHGPPPEPWESPMDRLTRELREANEEIERLRVWAPTDPPQQPDLQGTR